METDQDPGLSNIATALRRIAYGDTYPTGFESLVMALSGPGSNGEHPGGHNSIADALHGIAGALHDVAAAIRGEPAP